MFGKSSKSDIYNGVCLPQTDVSRNSGHVVVTLRSTATEERDLKKKKIKNHRNTILASTQHCIMHVKYAGGDYWCRLTEGGVSGFKTSIVCPTPGRSRNSNSQVLTGVQNAWSDYSARHNSMLSYGLTKRARMDISF